MSLQHDKQESYPWALHQSMVTFLMKRTRSTDLKSEKKSKLFIWLKLQALDKRSLPLSMYRPHCGVIGKMDPQNKDYSL